MNKCLHYIFALLAVIALIITGCGGSSDNIIINNTNTVKEIKEVSVSQEGSLSMSTSSGDIKLSAGSGSFDPDVKVKITENQVSEGMSRDFSTSSNLFTLSAEKVKNTSYGETRSKVTNSNQPVTIEIVNKSTRPGFYFLGMRANSNDPWKYEVINNDNSQSNPLPIFSRYAVNNYAPKYYVITYNVDFQFSIFFESEETFDKSKTIITGFYPEAEPSAYELENGHYKNDLTIKLPIAGDNLANLNRSDYIVEIGFLNDDNDEYNQSKFPISGAEVTYEVSEPNAGAGNKYKHTITLKNISDYHDYALSFGIGASKLTQQILPPDFTITVRVNEKQSVVPYEATRGVTLTNKSQKQDSSIIKVVSTSPANGAINVATAANITVTFDKELAADNDWASFITFAGVAGNVPTEISYADKTLTIKHNGLEAGALYTLQIKSGLKGVEAGSETETVAVSFITKKNTRTIVEASLKTPATDTGVSVSTAVEIAFTEDITWIPESKNLVTLLQGSNQVECSYSYENKVLTLTPTAKLGFNTTYTVKVSKYLGNMENDQQFEFTTVESEDTPAISPDTAKSEGGRYYLVADQKFYIDFNKSITNTITAKDSIYIQKGGASFNNYSVEFDSANQVATVNVNVPLESGLTYIIGVNEFSDNDGSTIKAANVSIDAMPALAVNSVEIFNGGSWQTASGSNDIDITGKIKIVMNQAVDPAIVKLVASDGSEISGSVISNKTTERSDTIEFDFSGLAYMTTYGVAVSCNDTATGQTMESVTHTFKTLIPDHLVLANESQPNSESNPYLVYCAAALDQIRDNAYRDHDYYFKQMVDINLDPAIYASGNNTETEGWKPFGQCANDTDYPTSSFTGYYDGNDKTIINMKSHSTSPEENPSLFGVINSGSVKNLTFENVDIDGKNYVGAVAGRTVNSVTIDNCHVSGNITTSQNSVGGMIGFTNETITLCNCSSDANITNSNTNTSRIYCAGGLIGYAYSSCDATDCHTTGEVSGLQYVGGLIGNLSYDRSTIENCDTTGKVTGSYLVGGLVGYVGSINVTINDCHCYNVTVSISNTGSGEKIGGIAGHNDGTITNCSVSGSVSGNNKVGGIVGSNECETGTCMHRINDNTTTCDVSGRDKVGGIVGYTTGEVNRCNSSGTITGNNNVGGIAGYNYNDQYNDIGLINSNTSKAIVRGNDNIGGILGYNKDGTYTDNTFDTSIGNVTANTENKGDIVGFDDSGPL